MESIHTWERKNNCISTHIGDAPTVHSGHHDVEGNLHYTRTYADGCKETTITTPVDSRVVELGYN